MANWDSGTYSDITYTDINAFIVKNSKLGSEKASSFTSGGKEYISKCSEDASEPLKALQRLVYKIKNSPSLAEQLRMEAEREESERQERKRQLDEAERKQNERKEKAAEVQLKLEMLRFMVDETQGTPQELASQIVTAYLTLGFKPETIGLGHNGLTVTEITESKFLGIFRRTHTTEKPISIGEYLEPLVTKAAERIAQNLANRAAWEELSGIRPALERTTQRSLPTADPIRHNA